MNRSIMATMRNNRNRALLGAILGALVIFPASWAVAAVAPPLPGMTLQIGSESFQVENTLWTYDATKDTFSLTGPFSATAADGSGSIWINNAEAVPDPLLLFAGGVVNNTNAPLAYSIAFNTPLVPNLLGPVDSHAELGLTLTDGLNDGATIQPTIPGGKMLTSFDLYSNGTPISKNVNIGDLFQFLGTPGNGTGGTNFSADNSLTCSQACVTMSAIMSFTLTGQDSAGFSGRVVQTPVPLPGAVLLFGSGLIGLVPMLRRYYSAS
jgi:hypothetical protein